MFSPRSLCSLLRTPSGAYGSPMQRLRAQDQWTSPATRPAFACAALTRRRPALCMQAQGLPALILAPAQAGNARRQRGAVCTAAAAAAAAVPATAAATPSVSSVAAVVVGWLVIAGSCIRSLPQILRILRNKSVEGLSCTSFTSELFCYMVSVAYNLYNGYAFSTFGDTAICGIQNVMIIGLIFGMGTVPRAAQLAIGGSLAATGWWLFTGACPPGLLTTLQAASVAVLAIGGRLPQILLNLRRGDSGELSLISCGLSLAGNLARVFTTAILVRDPIILGSAATQAILNGVLTWQCIDTARRSGKSEAGGSAPAPVAA